MSRQGVTLMCYWNGTMMSGPHGISYEGASPKPIRVGYGITHNELVDRIYGVTGFDKQSFKLKIICRYPACREYIPVPIDDDESIDIMFDVARQPGTNCLELYVEREPLCSHNPINVPEPTIVDNQTTDEIATDDAQVDSFLDPGPVDNSILVLQNQHRSEAIWMGEDPSVLTCRQRLAAMMKDWQLDPRVRHLIIKAGFYGVHRVGILQIDWPLITALVERWRQETHTFHLTVGESTVTLQDVALLLGLQVNGWVVTGNTDLQWEDLCEELLGLRPDSSVLHGSALKVSWLRTHFQEPPSDADDITLQRYARAYILSLMGSVLFADKSGADVQLMFLPFLRDLTSVGQFSWGSAVLAHLYRELCRASKKGANEISGPLVLLQIWAWERLDISRPERLAYKGRKSIILDTKAEEERSSIVGDATIGDEQLPADPLGCRWKAAVIRRDNPHRALIFYRDLLDQQTENQMVWQPYTSERLGSLPDSLLRDPHVWRTVAPLICFDIVEWHHPERVLRQFGLCQEIPVPCDTETKLHIIDRRGKHHYDWKAYHGQYIKLWEAREESIATGKLEEQPMHYHDPYMVWYRNVTRRLITPLTQRSHMRFQPSSGTSHLLVQSLTTIHNQCACALDSFTSDGAMKSLECIQTTCVRVLQMIGETRHLKGKQSVISTKPITIIPSSADDANNTENQQHEECISSSVHTAAILTKAPFVRGRGRGRGRARGSIKSQGGGYCNVQSVVVETSPRSSLSTHSAPEALQPDNGSDRQLHMKDTEVGSMIEPVDLGSAETSPESEKETCVREKSPVQSFLMYKEIKRDILPSTRPMHLSKGDKMAQSVRLLEPEDESMHLLGKEDLERTVASPKVGSKFGSCNLSHEQSDHPTFPKKKRKHI